MFRVEMICDFKLVPNCPASIFRRSNHGLDDDNIMVTLETRLVTVGLTKANLFKDLAYEKPVLSNNYTIDVMDKDLCVGDTYIAIRGHIFYITAAPLIRGNEGSSVWLCLYEILRTKGTAFW
ncbi:hypothetical protein J6590_096743 [Homalodisca vitripennis]|nr:hypothetical protein J6590_096743 [Homalodisca vitripennis]